MDQLKKPIWFALCFLFPLVLLIFLFNETYQIVESLLSAEQKKLWIRFGYYYSLLSVISTVYIGFLLIKRRTVHFFTAWTVLVINILNITLYFFFVDEVLPRDIPSWMFTSSDLTLYPYSFLIPGALYALILLVIDYTPDPKSKNAYINLVPAVVIPLFVFAVSFGLNIFSSGRSLEFFLFKYVPIFLVVFLTCAFLFFMIRFIYILSLKSKKRHQLELILKIIFTCCFPIAGLLFNNAFNGMFGDFTHPLFFILSVVNGVVLCLPDITNTVLRWITFIVKSVLFVFILYFCGIFLPFLPLSIIAIIIIGFGFLMLAPLIVFVYQVTSIKNDINYLSSVFGKPIVYTVFFLSLSVLPAAITINYQMDRNELDRIFAFLYERSFEEEKEYSFDSKQVGRLLNHIEKAKLRFLDYTPFLDSYYNWIVLDNLMLSDNKLNEISSVFKGSALTSHHQLFSWFTFPEHKATLDKFKVESNYNGKYWTSFLHLEVKSEEDNDTEFRMFLKTPNDCHISNYYLEIEGKKEFGILAEKKSANWVYNNIVKTRRDPGLLNWIGLNKYLLKVYPVQKKENRFTGIEFVHKEPIQISLNDTIVTLGDTVKASNKAYEILNGQGLFVPAKEKLMLPKVVRKPQYHFIIDHSINNSMTVGEIEKTVNSLLDSLPSRENVNLWAVNYNVKHLEVSSWRSEIESMPLEGGFYPEYLMKKILFMSLTRHEQTCPIFVFIKPDSSAVTFMEGFSNFIPVVPDAQCFYSCDNTLRAFKYSLESGKQDTVVYLSSIKPDSTCVIDWKKSNYYLACNNESEILFDSVSIGNPDKWESGILLDQDVNSYAFYPGSENAWLNIIKSSMRSGLLSPFTSYLSLENEAQKKALLHKQKEVMESNEHFDLEEAEPMSEPGVIWYIIILVVGYVFSRKYRQLKKVS